MQPTQLCPLEQLSCKQHTITGIINQMCFTTCLQVLLKVKLSSSSFNKRYYTCSVRETTICKVQMFTRILFQVIGTQDYEYIHCRCCNAFRSAHIKQSKWKPQLLGTKETLSIGLSTKEKVARLLCSFRHPEKVSLHTPHCNQKHVTEVIMSV